MRLLVIRMHVNESVHLQVEHSLLGSLAPAWRASDDSNGGLVDNTVEVDMVLANCQDERKRGFAIVDDKIVSLWVKVTQTTALRICVVKVADALLIKSKAIVHRSLSVRLNSATFLQLFFISKVDDLVVVEAILALD